jgi:hypothetical protein
MEFLDYAAAQVGCLYVSGGQGQTMTPALIRKLEKDDSDYKRALAHYNKHVKAGETLIGYDCSGLVIYYLLSKKLIDRDYNANGIYYDLCNPIAKTDLRAGDLVFKKYLTNSRMYHVGVYMGDGTVVHAKGRDYGVVRKKLSATGWNRFGWLKVFAETQEDEGMIVFGQNNNENVYASQLAFLKLGYDLGDYNDLHQKDAKGNPLPTGADGDAGKKWLEALSAIQKKAGLAKNKGVNDETQAAIFKALAALPNNTAELDKLKAEYAAYKVRVNNYVGGCVTAASMKI